MLSHQQEWHKHGNTPAGQWPLKSLPSPALSRNSSWGDWSECESRVCDKSVTDSSTDSSPKKVRFSPRARVCLVPCRRELQPFDLYWRPSDYCAFRESMICEWNEERAKEDEVLSHSEDIVQVVWLKFRRQQKHAGPAMSKLQSSKEIDHFHKSTSSKFKELIWVVECKKSSSQYW